MHNCSFMPTMTDIIDHNRPMILCDGPTYLVKCFHSDLKITSDQNFEEGFILTTTDIIDHNRLMMSNVDINSPNSDQNIS